MPFFLTFWSKKNIKITGILLLICCLSGTLMAQDYILDGATNNTTITTCSGTFYDSGGPSGQYQGDEDYTITFCSNNGSNLSITFPSFEMEETWEQFAVYDGPDTGSPEMAGSPFSGTQLQNQTLTSSGTCLTINFSSGSIIEFLGWEGEITCDCQPVIANVDEISGNLVDEGFQVCVGEEVTFEGSGTYPDNNNFYEQSDATSEFMWDFGDGVSDEGTTVTHVYDEPGVYFTSLTIEDVNGCFNSNLIENTILVSPEANFNGSEVAENEICLGQQNTLTGLVSFNTYEVECDPVESSLVFLPDGDGVSYESPITLDCYGENATLQDIDDLENICLNIEHSYTGDLQIEITCPNGQNVILLDEDNSGGGTYLGEPVDIDNQPNSVGVGYDYCFNNDPTYGTLDSSLPGESQPAGSYESWESLNGLLGCPLNGDWTITITDNITSDNGYLFSWFVDLNDDLEVGVGAVVPEIVSSGWQDDPTIIDEVDGVITVEPTEIGENCYTFEVENDFGCSYDTTICFNVVSSSITVEIDPIETICEQGAAIVANASPIGGVWSGDVAVDGIFDPNVGAGDYTAIYTVTDDVGCVISDEMNFIVVAIPTLVLTEDTVVACENMEAIVNIELQGEPPFTFEYLLDGISQGEINTDQFNFPLGVGESGNYSVASMSDAYCDGEVSGVTTVVFADPLQVTNITEECALDQLTYTVSFELSGGDSTAYAVDGGTITNGVFTSDPILSELPYSFEVSDGGFCMELEVSGVFECQCLATATIMTPEVTFCEGDTAVLEIALSGDEPFTVEYARDNISQGTFTTTDTTYFLEVTAGGTYSILEIADLYCVGEGFNTAEAIEHELPDPTFGGPNTICLGGEEQLEIALEGEGPWQVNYTMDGGAAQNIVANTSPYLLTINSPGTCEVVEVTDQNCTSTNADSYEVTINEAPVAVIDSTMEMCVGEVAQIEVELAEGLSYNLTYEVNDVIQPEVTGIIGDEYIIEVTETSTVQLVAITDEQCEGTVTGQAQANYHELPTATIFGEVLVCEGDSAQLQVDLTGDGTITVDYGASGSQWQFETADTVHIIESAVAGNYTLISVEDDYCVGTTSGTGVINNYPEIVIAYNQLNEACEGSEVSFEAIASGGFGSDYTYLWSNLSEPISYTTQATLAAVPDQLLEITVTDECGTVETLEVPVNYNLYPDVSFESIEEICGPGFVSFTNTTPSEFWGNCAWVIAGDTITQCAGLDYFFGQDSTYEVGLIVNSPAGCESELFISDYLTVLPVPESDFTMNPDKPTIARNEVHFNNMSQGTGLTYDWSFGDFYFTSEENPTVELPIENGPDSWYACLSTTNEVGCVDSLCMPLILYPDILSYIPNTFTPDGDGLNDLFYPVLYGADSTEYNLTIYDRLGKKVFYTEDINAKWNGSNPRTTDYFVPDGVYHYVINVRMLGSAEIKKIKGWITLLR